MTILEALKKTRERLTNPAAWRQSAFGPEEGPNCLGGAVFHVTDGGEACEAALRVLTTEAGVNHLIGFNDAPGRTHAEVLDLLDRCIASVTG